MKKLLFISHDASRTGAPIVLLNFLSWLKQQGKYEIAVYLIHGGELESSFKQLANTFLPKAKTLPQRIAKRILKNTHAAEQLSLPQALLSQTFDGVYLNTVASLHFAPYIKAVFKCLVICHVHENDFTIKNYYPQYLATENLSAVNRFIAVSKSTRDNLIQNYALTADKIDLVYPFIALEKVKQPSLTKQQACAELSLNNEFIIGGSGLTIWRKGPDLFLQLAVALNELRPGNLIKLVWVGALTHEFSCQYNYEAGRLGLTHQVIFTGTKPVPQNYFQLFDVFALTSREDPFPLVALEAASLNKPIVCFDGAGGMPELITDGENGIIIPYGNVIEMAKRILALADDKALLLNMGTKVSKLVEKFDIDVVAPKIVQIIDKLLSN